MSDAFEPWDEAMRRSGRDQFMRDQAQAMTDFWLDRIGCWLYRVVPALEEGGNVLVISPHRLFRSLPLSHARLPSGRLLSELFDAVYVVPNLFWFAQRLGKPEGKDFDPRIAVVNPTADLPFAELEAGLCFDSSLVVKRQQVTSSRLQEAVKSAGLLLLSCHGEFDGRDGWDSSLFLADGRLALLEFVSALHEAPVHLLVLGACEAGRHRRALSDEPVGFAGLALMYGASYVLAPLWKVDDLAASLYLTRFFALLDEGILPGLAAKAAAVALRDLNTYDARRVLSEWKSKPPARGLEASIDRYLDWLEDLPWNERPFRSPRDWAAFQLTGFIETGGKKTNDN